MLKPPYLKRNLILKRGPNRGNKELVRALQRDLRSLGYLRKGIDGQFGGGTEKSIKALQHDLLFNHGESTRRDGNAPIAIADFSKGRVIEVDGILDSNLARCIGDLLDCDDFPKVPSVEDPRSENREIIEKMKTMKSKKVPIPFLLAILKKESNLKHFNEPRLNSSDEDTFVVVGLDTNSGDRNVITSRGYGAGQYTLFHHPPTKREQRDFIQDWKKNLNRAIDELKSKFDHFVNGATSGTQADDRLAEVGSGPLRMCKFSSDDPRYLNDCRQCAVDAGKQDIVEGVTRFHRGTRSVFKPTQYYNMRNLNAIPIRKNFECDWPYATRRYNGSGINSYHYQVRILKKLLKP